MLVWWKHREIMGYLMRTVVIQPLSHVWLFLIPWTAAHWVSLSFAISWSFSNSCPLSQWCLMDVIIYKTQPCKNDLTSELVLLFMLSSIYLSSIYIYIYTHTVLYHWVVLKIILNWFRLSQSNTLGLISWISLEMD